MTGTDFRPDDIKKVKYFARLYATRLCPAEDLEQAGYIALLETTNPSHKHLAVRKAIQTSAMKAHKTVGIGRRRETGHKNARTDLLSVPSEEEGFSAIDISDELTTILDKTDLTDLEASVIFKRHFEDLTFNLISDTLSRPLQTIRDTYATALTKLQATASKLA